MTEEEKFEQDLLKAIAANEPQPEFKLWQKTNQGVIVGYCWYSVSHAYENNTDPGWWYVVSKAAKSSAHHYVHESDIKGIEDDSDTDKA